jgi:hypothetical protein
MRDHIKENVFDFESSYLTYIAKDRANYGRFQIESMCAIQDNADSKQYYATNAVTACDVYGKGQLIKEPACRFQALFLKTHFKIFRTYLETLKQSDSTGAVESAFEGLELNLHG